jgi:hypothetical protein
LDRKGKRKLQLEGTCHSRIEHWILDT